MKQPSHYAKQLWQARLTGQFCNPIAQPLSIAQAYSIQDACTEAASENEQVVGYKIGATAKETLDILGLDEPFYGPLYKSAFDKINDPDSHLALPLFTQHKSRVEAEFVVCMKNDFARSNNNADIVVEDILEHIEWVAPGLEVVASRFVASRVSEAPNKPGCLAIADFGANQHMIVGQPFEHWRELDLSAHAVKLEISNQPDINGHSGMSIFGNPLAFVCWLLNQPALHKSGLQAGQLVSCGTCTGAPFIETGDHITADYGSMGKLAIEIVAKSAT